MIDLVSEYDKIRIYNLQIFPYKYAVFKEFNVRLMVLLIEWMVRQENISCIHSENIRNGILYRIGLLQFTYLNYGRDNGKNGMVRIYR